ncbi:hypothetical protein F5Y08DRAFT_323443 [Xylaria arbuscula]|uniref:Uncharacterized protein n=1 Tax=Xylaria arbuscula TaxID=114810 RepID=A0A9W8TJP0_9PEZI|nr:hypothetical protein F5Y08DRAFT_323443 [Xylaria arbuscula]KAJ3566224.1 hypothetical protein NPX13_g7218 [Xylaria arbuscula]
MFNYALVTFLCFVALLSVDSVFTLEERQACTYARRQSGVAQEIKTISSHFLADAAEIPLAPLASRTFFVTPSELGVALPPINVGLTADTVRTELVILGAVLNANVPAHSVHYINNSNGSVTVDFIQIDSNVLPHEQVREIHEFDQRSCQITKITGYVHGPVICNPLPTNPTLILLCNELGATA